MYERVVSFILTQQHDVDTKIILSKRKKKLRPVPSLMRISENCLLFFFVFWSHTNFAINVLLNTQVSQSFHSKTFRGIGKRN